MQIDYCLYELSALKKLNRFHQNKFAGVLLRINKIYFLDYFPWEEFGDQSVLQFLDKLKPTKKLPAFMHQLLSLEQEKELIKNKPFYNHGQTTIKLKYLGSLDNLKKQLTLLTHAHIRIDFNNGLNKFEALSFWQSLPLSIKNKIDYLEDPCPANELDWSELAANGIPLACDRNPKFEKIIKAIVFKPNIEQNFEASTKKIFSSYMGHDLGRYHCYLALMKWGDLNEAHGVDTPGIYQNQKELFQLNGDQLSLNKVEVSKLYLELRSLNWTTL
jgi:hypothetical protein